MAERIAGHEALRHQDEQWERDRRKEDREDRRVKDEELNNVRLQLRDQAATFATKDLLTTMERAFDARLDTLEKTLAARIDSAVERLNDEGTEGYRESEAARKAREDTADKILSGVRTSNENAATNRRWLIGLAVTITFGVLANMFTLVTLALHMFHII